ncbi:MAG TPA: CHC2 zinc finger domain-containing protein [Saprospiraceae bacterium]|nr:CHC2 zinc finger domain-containing protein [Saprospiraceae bacterium]
MITQKSVQEILDTVKIEDVVQDFVSLRRRGTNLIGLCPFHHEKTPSFNVSPARNIFKCFGCGKGGNAVQFLMELERFTFPEALKYIAKKYGIQIEEIESSREAAEERRVADSLYIINQYALEFFQNQLVNTDRGRSVGLSYFRERGFREETIQKFGLGYAPEKRDQFLTTATAAGYDQQMLFNLGLCSPPDASRNLPPRDFFRDRVIFPIHGMSGKVIAFAGRIMAKDVKAPKYINSPEPTST